MNHYRCSVLFAAPVAQIYDALTTPDGLRGWWTTTCDVGLAVGDHSIFRFGRTHNVMRIEQLRMDEEVHWQCIEQHLDAPGQVTRTDEWVGTTLVFRLGVRPPANTLLEFEHIGLTPQLECYALCERGWDHYLKHSLKNFIETGRGEPYAEPAA